ncbi:putative AB hydrolase-1 domain-containing protein [Seiridium unicorne]|uniref:AB hydrolase-1 domain-containing protein n=1 Tax=Seiridium unicorne TaxID=138068 RepID=A0ABR2VI05_9PEZI
MPMAPSRALQTMRVLRQLSSVRAYSTTSRVPLAFDHHAPPEGKETHSPTSSPILFMHGLFGSRKNNRSVSKVLARDLGRHVYTLDLRNHGESPHDPVHNYSAMSDDVAHFIATHKLESPTLVGHSMGAKCAMTLALAEPALVKDIVSVDNAPLDAVLASDFGKYIQGMKRIEAAGVTKQSEADKILAEYEKELPIRQFLLGNLHRPQGEKTQKFRVPLSIIAKELDNMGDFPFKDPEKVRFEKPALFVRGTKSKYVPDEVIPLIGRFFPKFQMVDIDAGHWVISECPEPFLKAVIEFLTREE